VLTAEPRGDEARAGPEPLRGAKQVITPIRVLTGLVVAAAAAVYEFAVAPLPQGKGSMWISMLVFVVLFAACESWRVSIEFRRTSQTYSLSEIPLVIGVFLLSPGHLLLARVVGSAIALGVVRRQAPVKLIFNMASFALEAETLTVLVHVVSGTHATDPVTWLWVALFTLTSSLLGFVLSAAAITVTQGGRVQWAPPLIIVVVGGIANCSLGLTVVALLASDRAILALLFTPLAAVCIALVLYTQEQRRRERLQHLYGSSDLLQRATSDGAAIPELLDRLCTALRADIATVSLLPVATGTASWRTIRSVEGRCDRTDAALSPEHLENLVPLLSEPNGDVPAAHGRGRSQGGQAMRGLIAAPSDARMRAWLREQGFKDAMATLLQGEGMLLGTLVVADRHSDAGTFDADDLPLFDAFAAQIGVVVQNTRLGQQNTHLGDRLHEQAFHDAVSGLPNRALFMDRLEHALTRRGRQDASLAVMFLDLDDFKTVNDSLGHVAGDELLAKVAERLADVLRASDTPARFGGDEFAILIEETADPLGVAERILSMFKPRFVVAGREVGITASVGVAATASRDVTAEELVGRADVAMYRAKVKGKNTYEVFEPGMQDVIERRLEVRTHLERAIRSNELVVLYQPIVDLATSMPVGVEALVRWRHPQWGMVVPAEFIGIAEETGMIRELGIHVLEEACRQWQEWQRELIDEPSFNLSVNVSPRQLRDPDFVSEVWRVLSRTGVPPSHLTLEITENFMVDDPVSARARLRELKNLGVRISMDDFGIGYSSLASLQDLPLDILKIDKAFVDHIAEDPRRTAFAAAIIRMGKTLGLELVAEGVETSAQSDRLQSLGCRLAQGFYFSRPVTGDDIMRMLHASQAMRVAGGNWATPDAPPAHSRLRVLEESA
jgi:diguanylate cyclase (GGDEF)-like protein